MLRVARLHFVVVLVIVGCAVSPAAALAVAPENDGYLQSIGIPFAEGEPIMDRKDTREATVQGDLFAPPRSGGGAERTDCSGTRFGATVWYDFLPRFDGTMSVAGSGFDTVAGVYEFDRGSEHIGSRVACSVAEELFVKVKGAKAYTIQVGGVDAGAGAGPATGDLTFKFEYFANRDGDNFLDALDDCDTTPGTLNGCPPELRADATLRAAPTGRGIRVSSLSVDAPRGSRVKVRCQRGCAFSQTRTALTSRPLRFPRLGNRQLPAGARLEIFVTKAKSIGSYTRYTVTRGNFKRIRRCLRPGSLVPRTSCK